MVVAFTVRHFGPSANLESTSPASPAWSHPSHRFLPETATKPWNLGRPLHTPTTSTAIVATAVADQWLTSSSSASTLEKYSWPYLTITVDRIWQIQLALFDKYCTLQLLQLALLPLLLLISFNIEGWLTLVQGWPTYMDDPSTGLTLVEGWL